MIISLNISMTADGKTNLPGLDRLNRIGNQEDMERMKELRKNSDAIIIGSRTVITDNIALRVLKDDRRMIDGLIYPLRIVIVGMTLPPVECNVFKPELGGTTLIACGVLNRWYVEQKLPDFMIIECGIGQYINPLELVRQLNENYSVENILIEGGPTINGIFLDNNLVDRYYVTVCPYLFGGKSDKIRTPVNGIGVRNTDEHRLKLLECKVSADWMLLTYEKQK
ncbi:RibD family protein [bacterium]|nr:RibD family protein [bacterium]